MIDFGNLIHLEYANEHNLILWATGGFLEPFSM